MRPICVLIVCRPEELLVCSVVDVFALAVCHVFASCFDWLVGFWSAITLVQRLWTHDVALDVNVIFEYFLSFSFAGSKGWVLVRAVFSIHGFFHVEVSMMFRIFVSTCFGPVSLLPLPSAVRARRCAEPVVQCRGKNTTGHPPIQVSVGTVKQVPEFQLHGDFPIGEKLVGYTHGNPNHGLFLFGRYTDSRQGMKPPWHATICEPDQQRLNIYLCWPLLDLMNWQYFAWVCPTMSPQFLR